MGWSMKIAIEIMNNLKQERLIKDYAIGGAIGVLKWVEPFFTSDLDIFVITEQEVTEKNIIVFTKIYDYLKEKGYNQWIGQWIIIGGVPVELLPAEGLKKEAVENAVETEYEGVKARVMTPEYLIALLLEVGRYKDIIKVKMLFEQTVIDKEKLGNILDKYNLKEKYDKYKKEIFHE